MATEVSFSYLDTWLTNRPENTPQTPYEITIIDFRNDSTIDRLRTILMDKDNKYVDLSTTILPLRSTSSGNLSGCRCIVKSPVFPYGTTSFKHMFFGCDALIEAPEIPETVTDMSNAFRGCTFTTTPEIPNSVTDMSYAFFGCTSLTTVLEIPNSVTDMSYAFYRCTSLTTVSKLPNSVTNMDFTFRECTSLVVAPEIPNSVISMNNTFERCTSLTTPPVIPDSVTSISSIFRGCTSLVVAPEIPDSVISMGSAFQECTSLTTIPNFPNAITSLYYTFCECTSLTSVPEIPESVYDFYYAFYNCTSLREVSISGVKANATRSEYFQFINAFYNCRALTTVRIKNYILNNDYAYYTGMFYNCYALRNFHCNNPYNLKNRIESLGPEHIPSGYTHYYRLYSDNEYVEISINNNNFSNTLYALSDNTSDTAYKIKVTDLDTTNYVNMCDVRGKYVDYRETELPNELTDMTGAFRNCSTMTNAPAIPANVIVLDSTFSGCSSLKEAPEIPNGVTDLDNTFNGCSTITTAPEIPSRIQSMNGTFKGCTSLELISNVPNLVTDLTETFANCSNLEEISKFEAQTYVLKTNAADCFKNCSNLTKIGIPSSEITETPDWHIVLLDFDSSTVKGKIYDKDGSIVVIPETVITKDKLVLPIYTDELLFTDSLSSEYLEDLIENVLTYRYGYYNKVVLSPKNSSFVLFAKDPNSFITNLPITGGGGGGGGGISFNTCYPIGCTYTQYPMQKSPMELWGTISIWEVIDYGGTFFRASGGNSSGFNNNVMTIQSMSGSTITIINHHAEVGTVIYDFTNNESRVVTSISGNVITLNSPFTNTSTLRDVLIGQPQSLPNITARVSCDSEGLFNGRGSIYTSGAFSVSGGNKYCGGDNGDTGRPNALSFNAQSAESTYGRRPEVSPNNFSIVIWRRTA